MPLAAICLVYKRLVRFSYTPSAVIGLVVRDGICLVLGRWGVSLTRPVLKSVWSYVGRGVYLTSPVLSSVSSFDCWEVSSARLVPESVSSDSGWGVSLTRQVL